MAGSNEGSVTDRHGKARFPWLLTTLHATATAFGCFVLVGLGHLQLTHLSTRDHVKLTAFSFLFTLNIAMSNVSLGLVSVPFHQVMRSTCPIVTILIIRVLYGKEYSIKTYLSMIPLVLGVALATARDYHFSMLGFVLTLAGVVLASVKTVATNRLMTGSLALSAPEVLLRMSPLAAVQCLVYAFFVGEVDQVRENYAAGGLPSPMFAAALVLNASFALLLNFVSFQTNKIAGPLTMSICGNAKQVLTIALGILLFNVQVGPSGYCGLLIALGGAAWYSKTELESRASKTPG